MYCLATVQSFFIMSSKRKSDSSSNNINFRPQTESKKWETKGTKPLPNPVTIQETFVTMIIHVCRKILFFNTKLRVVLYLAGLFLSFVFDVLPFPKTYFSKTDNFLNQYFVKIGWAWTVILILPFVLLTSFTYCCGKRDLVLRHLSRLIIATAIWFIFTKAFALIEVSFGKCSKGKDIYKSKRSCISDGYFWHSLDISGHTFILMWSTLVIIEEAKVINGWESIKDMIRNEAYSRLTNEFDFNSPLKKLSDQEFHIMKSSYNKFTPYIKALFIIMTGLTLIWDTMMITTILYFHVMIEKIIAGLLASVMWFLTYNFWYIKMKFPPDQPGFGLFKFIKKANKQKENFVKSKVLNSNSNLKRCNQPSNLYSTSYVSNFSEKDKPDRWDSVSIAQEQEVSNKMTDKKLNENLQNTRQGVTTRSQTLKNLRLNGNKTI